MQENYPNGFVCAIESTLKPVSICQPLIVYVFFMKVVFLTNQASYHQVHFARAMAIELGTENFRIIFHKGTSASRAEMGWKDDYDEPFILRYSESDQVSDECLEWIEEADVVIQGRFPIKYVRARINAGKLTFACQERLWKKPPSWKRKISRAIHLYKNYYSVDKPNYHFLAIGANAAKDLNDMGVFVGRSWRFGYFIDCPKPVDKPKSEVLKLLWCARFSKVKQPLKALDILSGLSAQGIEAHLTMIGDGDLREQTELAAKDFGLSGMVTFEGWQTQQEVFNSMLLSDLFLMTSDHGEGWGLVVNEALSHGCGVVANAELGSAQWLVKHGQNGLLYHDRDLPSVINELVEMGPSGIRNLGVVAHPSIRDNWSATVAASRTIALSKELLQGGVESASALHSAGLCSLIR